MKLLFEGSTFIETLMPAMPTHHVVCLDQEIVDGFPQGSKTRVVLRINGGEGIQCGLNPHIPGVRCMMVNKAHMKSLGLMQGERVAIEVFEDPNPLGVEIPEVLEVLMEQDAMVAEVWSKLTDGRKRTICHSTRRIKNLDLQIQKALEFFAAEQEKQRSKKRK
jgi:hypothetical protein